MLVLVLEIFGYILLGGAVLGAAVLGLPYLLAREINAGHEPTCQCSPCQLKRQRRWQAEHGQDPGIVRRVNQPRTPGPWRKDQKPLPSRSTWVSTLELQAGMTVHGKVGTPGTAGATYKVLSVIIRPFGFRVTLVNQLTQKTSIIPVQSDQAQQRIWLIRRQQQRGRE